MYDRWNEAVQKFDYYIVGIVGAGLVLLLRDLRVEQIGWTADTLRAGGVFLLLLSFIAGLIRLERFHMLLRFEHERLKIAPYRDAVKGGATNILREATYDQMTPEQIKAFETKLDRNHATLQKALAGLSTTMGRAYFLRNWSLLLGLLLLFCAAFAPSQQSSPSSPKTPALPPPANHQMSVSPQTSTDAKP